MYVTLRRTVPLLALLFATTHARADRIDDLMRDQMARNHIPGAAVAVVRNGRIEALRAYGVANLEHNSPVTTASPFQIASVTKTFTGLLLAHLIDQGKLSMDEPVSRYLPEAPAEWSGITVRHLAKHTAGFAMSEPGPTTETMEQAVAAIMKRPLAANPGDREQYALDDFVVLARIMQKVSGKSYEQLLDEVVIKPLGLKDTRFEHAIDRGSQNRADVIPGRVSVYNRENGQQRLFWFLYPPATYAGGGIFTSIADMARVMRAIDRGELAGGPSRKEIWTAPMLNNGKPGSFGAGWIVGTTRGLDSVGHSGGPALGDVLYVPGEHLGVVVLINQRVMYPNLAQAIAAQYLPPSKLVGAAGITDQEPALTTRLFATVRALAAGKADASAFGGELREQVGEYNKWMTQRMSTLPAVTRMVLLSDEAAEGKRVRTYRVTLGKEETQRWRLDLDKDGLITDFDITAE